MKGCIIIIFFCFSFFHAHSQYQQKTDSLLAVLKDAKQDTSKVNTLILIAREYLNSKPDSANYFLSKSLALSQTLKYDKGIGTSYHVAGIACFNLSKNEEALGNYNKALPYRLLDHDSIGYANTINNIGNVYRVINKYDLAMKFLQQGLELRKRIGINKDIAASLMNIGTTLQELGNNEKAIATYFESIKFIGDVSNHREYAYCYNNIGNAYRSLGKESMALPYFRMSLDNLKFTNDEFMRASVLINIGASYNELQQNDSALKYYNEALLVQQQMGYDYGTASCLMDIGNVYSDKKKPDKSLEYYSKALPFVNKINQPGMKSMLLMNIGNSQNIKGDFKNGLKNAAAAFEIASQFGSKEHMKGALKVLVKSYEGLGDYKAAYKYQNRMIEIKDSLLNEVNNKQIAELQTKYDTEKKDNEISLLNKDKALLKKDQLIQSSEIKKQKLIKNSILGGTLLAGLFSFLLILSYNRRKKAAYTLERHREAERIRSRISQDIHDDISSGLTKISWLSESLKSRILKNNLEDAPSSLNKIILFSKDTIGKLGEIIWATNPEHDNLNSMLSYMRSYVGEFLDDTPFHFVIDFPESTENIAVNPELKRNLYLVMKEALNNAVKYSNAKNIRVAIFIKEKHYTLSIEDDGKGIRENVIEGGGNGLINMRKRMESVNGIFKLETGNGIGTKVILTGAVS